jgi:hypothetical protein
MASINSAAYGIMMSLYWLCYRHNNHISVVIGPEPSVMLVFEPGLPG